MKTGIVMASAALEAAQRAASACDVDIREAKEIDELKDVAAIYETVWSVEPGRTPITPDLLKALASAGSYLVGVYHRERIVGASVGFCAPPGQRTLHSHIAGVVLAARGRHVGFAIKLHQRYWCLARGIDTISWTYDPLIARNAYFNLAKLGALLTKYMPDFYGQMTDGINRLDASDRVYARWDLSAQDVRARCGDPGAPALTWAHDRDQSRALVSVDPDGTPRVSECDDARELSVAIPADSEQLRMADPRLHRRWRHLLREVLTTELARGSNVVGFDRTYGYLIERDPNR